MHAFFDSFQSALGLGLEPKSFTFLQIVLRGLIVFGAALVMVRLSDRRSLTKKSPFDQMLLVILASVLARAVNGSSAFLPTLGGAAVLVGAHRLLAFACCRWSGLTAAIKGRPWILVSDGVMRTDTMQSQQISKDDVWEDMRLNAHVDDLIKVKSARLEVSGDVSFILREGKA